MTPEQLARPGTEHAHQVALFAACALAAPQWPRLRLLFAIHNQGHGDRIRGSRAAAEGMKAGVPDVFLPVSIGYYKGLFIEMKRPELATHKDGGASSDQLEWMHNLKEQGYRCIICFGWQHALETLKEYLS